MDPKTILFGVVGWNIAETTRMIEIAKALPQGFRGEFLSYGGQFEHLVTEAGLPLHRMEPQEGPEKIDLLWRIDRGETYAQPFTLEELRERIRGEEELLSTLRPRAVVMCSVLTFPLSVRLAGLPLINVIPFALSREYFANGLPAAPGKPRWINALFRWFAQKVPILTKNFNAAARELGLPKFDSLLSLWEGDINLLTELPQTFPQVQLPPNWQFVGPIFCPSREPYSPGGRGPFAKPRGPHNLFRHGQFGQPQGPAVDSAPLPRTAGSGDRPGKGPSQGLLRDASGQRSGHELAPGSSDQPPMRGCGDPWGPRHRSNRLRCGHPLPGDWDAARAVHQHSVCGRLWGCPADAAGKNQEKGFSKNGDGTPGEPPLQGQGPGIG
jgi:hypothetical protein